MSAPKVTAHSSPMPGFPPGPRYKLTITFHGASHLPIADVPSFTSDPYVVATLRFPGTLIPKMHYRTQTQRSTLSPSWEESWGVANVPVTGVMLKVKIMDEDPGNHDDKLGVTQISTGQLDVEGAFSGEGGGKGLEKRQTLDTGRGTWVGLLRVATVMAGRGGWGGKGQVDVGIKVEEMPKEETDWDVPDRAYTVFPSNSPPPGPALETTTGTVNVVGKTGGVSTSPR